MTIIVIGVTYPKNQDAEKTPKFSVQIVFEDPYTEYDNMIKNTKTGNLNSDRILSSCGIDEHCTVEALYSLAKKENQETVISTMKDIISSYQKINILCHRNAHHIGEFLLGFANGNVSKAISYADRGCGGALYHGIVENYFVTQVVLNDEKPESIKISNICDGLGINPFSQLRLECIHGIGHGLLKVYNYDIFSATDRCNVYENILEQTACYKGAFMANTVEFVVNEGGTFDMNDIFYPCTQVNEEKAPSCYQFQPVYLLKIKKYSNEDVFDECDKINPEKFVKYCYYGMGIQISRDYINDHETFANECKKGTENYWNYCIAGAAIVIADQIGINQTFEFCKIVDEDFKFSCYDTLGKFVHAIDPSDLGRESICSKAESPNYSSICMNANVQELGIL